MNDLVQSQIQDSCRLALPDGLKELMWDISREVLRAQPADLCTFISEYLLALLVTRENSIVAHSICGEVCTEACRIPLDEELKAIGFNEDDAAKAKKIAEKMFELDEVKECEILNKILELDSMNEVILPAVQDAVCKAYLIHQHPYICKTPSDVGHLDVVDQAVHHTLRLYRNTKPSEEEYEKAAINIQAAYRAYGVRRSLDQKTSEQVSSDGAKFYEQDDFFSGTDDHDDGVYTVLSGEYFSTVHYHHEDPCDPEPSDVYKPVVRALDSKEFHVLTDHNHNPYLKTVSSTSLAGSFVHLPKFKPYTPISGIMESDENAENNDAPSNDASRKHVEREHRISEKEIHVSDYNELLEAKADEDSVNKINVVHDNIAKYNVKEIKDKRGSVLEDEEGRYIKDNVGDVNVEQKKITEENIIEDNDVTEQ